MKPMISDKSARRPVHRPSVSTCRPVTQPGLTTSINISVSCRRGQLNGESHDRPVQPSMEHLSSQAGATGGNGSQRRRDQNRSNQATAA